MRIESTRINVASAFVGAAAIWPSALCAITEAMATPLQRAMQVASCGDAAQPFLLMGHCPACWSGSAAFLLAATLALGAPIARRLGAGRG